MMQNSHYIISSLFTMAYGGRKEKRGKSRTNRLAMPGWDSASYCGRMGSIYTSSDI